MHTLMQKLMIAASIMAGGMIAGLPIQALACVQTVKIVPLGTSPVESGENLKNAIQGSQGCEILRLGNGTYRIGPEGTAGIADGVQITKSNLTIEGTGPFSKIEFTRRTYVGLAIDSNVSHMVLRNFVVSGSLTAAGGDDARHVHGEADPEVLCVTSTSWSCFGVELTDPANTHAIGVHGGVSGNSNVLISGLTIENVAVGISVGVTDGYGNCPANGFKNVTISGNTLTGIYGRDAGSGYGIVAPCVKNLLIIDNEIRNSGRHAIYVGRTADENPPDDVRIIRNKVIDHGHVNSTYAINNGVAIAVARSRNVSVVSNTIIGSHRYGISVESDRRTVSVNPLVYESLRGKNNAVIGNRFLDRANPSADIWLNAATSYPNGPGEDVIVWGNSQNGYRITCASQQILKSMGNCVDPAFWNTGVGTQRIEFVGNSINDVASAGMLAANSHLLIMQNDALHRVVPDWGIDPAARATDPTKWAYVYSTTNWSYGLGFQEMVPSGNDLFVMQHNTLHKVSIGTTTGAWPYTYSTTWWSPNYSSMCALGGNVFVVQYDVVHRVIPGTTASAWSYYEGGVNPVEIPGSGAIACTQDLYIRTGGAITKYDSGISNPIVVD